LTCTVSALQKEARGKSRAQVLPIGDVSGRRKKITDKNEVWRFGYAYELAGAIRKKSKPSLAAEKYQRQQHARESVDSSQFEVKARGFNLSLQTLLEKAFARLISGHSMATLLLRRRIARGVV
jgi:hypothetical protein